MDDLFDQANIGNIEPIRERVYVYIKKLIIEGYLNPGDRIIEEEFAQKMNVSRTPVREALRKLEIEGFIEYIPRKGVIVKGFTLKDIEEIYEIRKALENLNIKYVIKNISQQNINELKSLVTEMKDANRTDNIEMVFSVCRKFNDVLYNSGQMPKLTEMINILRDCLERFRRINMSISLRRINAINEHEKIFQAVVNKDIKCAQKLINDHLEVSKKIIIETLKSKGV